MKILVVDSNKIFSVLTFFLTSDSVLPLPGDYDMFLLVTGDSYHLDW